MEEDRKNLRWKKGENTFELLSGHIITFVTHELTIVVAI